MTANFANEQWLGATAYWTAAVRARETERDDRLLNDPWAKALAGEPGAAWIADRPQESTLPIVLRTRFFDDAIRRATHDEGIRQIVLLAAGMDTRAFRLDLPADTRVFEIDRRAVLEHKAAILQNAQAQPKCFRTLVAADITEPWQEKLASAGFEAQVPALFLLEGFLFYLPSSDAEKILADVSALAAPRSWLCFDIINNAMLTSPLTSKWLAMQAQAGAPWIGTLDNPVEFLATRGWHATLSQAGAPDANHGRWNLPVVPVDMPNFPHNWFVVAHKADAT